MNKDIKLRIINNEERDPPPEGNPYELPTGFPRAPAASIEPVSYEQMPVALQGLMDEHRACLAVTRRFEAALSTFKESKWQMSEEIQEAFSEFFKFYDRTLSAHNRREEKLLFPLLQEHFFKAGEYSAEGQLSAIEVLEEEHSQIAQGATLVFNLLGLAPRLPNWESVVVVFEHACNLGQELVETLRLHLIREDETLFPLACKYLSASEFEELKRALEVKRC
jgi:hemerythrin-like domain-containing protein